MAPPNYPMPSMRQPAKTPTDFESRVYEAVAKIPRGSVTTYGAIASAISSGSARAVGQALRKNPFARGLAADLFTALQFHELTTQLPRQIWIAMPRGSHLPRIDYPPVKMVQYSGAAYAQGIENHERDQVMLRVYSVAKTVVDCFKHRNKIGLDVALEALREARERNQVSADELWRYAKICRVANAMRPYLEALA